MGTLTDEIESSQRIQFLELDLRVIDLNKILIMKLICYLKNIISLL